jgi:carbamoyl-phosphate synthase small subunit
LEDGTIFEGEAFGKQTKVSGEVVFNTGMVGYTEAITDPSYKGQILCQTFPLIGNYGVCREDFESPSPKIQGYIVYEVCERPSHHTCEMDLNDWLKREGIPGIKGIDTRELTKRLRIHGVMLGILQTSEGIDKEKLLEEVKNIRDPNDRDLVSEVTTQKPIVYGNKGLNGLNIVVIDCGVKFNIIRCLLNRGTKVIRVPADTNCERVMDYKPDGILISNGPGDPKKISYVINTVKSLIEYKIPIMGICLGTQILGLALGGDTYKLKFGHRGQNHPVINRKGRCYITSQNHGYAIDSESSEGKFEVTFLNANDKSVEGIENKKFRIFGYQWHPEHSPGPRDSEVLFDKFLREVKHAKTRRD